MRAAEQADNARDGRLRFAILRLLESVSPSPNGIRGRRVRDMIDGANLSDHFVDDDHALRLLMDLNDDAYIALEDRRSNRDETYCLDKLDCRIKPKARRFLTHAEPPDGLIDDGRIQK